MSLDELSGFVVGEREFTRDQPVWSDRKDLQNLLILEKGWAYKFSIFPNGRRHIGEFFGPGAICNWSRFSEFVEQDDLMFKAGATVRILDRKHLGELFAERAMIETVFKRHEAARVMRSSQRVKALISLGATEQVLLLLLDFLDEEMASGMPEGPMRMPFTLEEVADMIGLSPVHVSRTLKLLQVAGDIDRSGGRVGIKDPDEVCERLGYRGFFKSRKS